MIPPPTTVLTRAVPAAYESVIARMRFHIEPEISCSRFFGMACFTDKSIRQFRATNDRAALERTEMGAFVADHLKDGLFVDVPCGLDDARERDVDFAMPSLVAALGARALWEIDLTADVVRDRLRRTIEVIDGGRYALMNGPGEAGERIEQGLSVSTMQDDVLGFVAKIDPDRIEVPKAIYVSALQPDAESCKSEEYRQDVAAPYLNALYDECARASKSGDLVILNSSAMLAAGIGNDDAHPALALPPRGFSLMRRCAFDKVHVFLKD